MAQVWMIVPSFYPYVGGAERQAQRLSEQLIAQGWEVNILTRRHNPRNPYLPPDHEINNGVPIHRIFSKGPSRLASLLFIVIGLWYLWRNRNDKANIYHAHGIGAQSWLAILARYLFGGYCIIKLRTGRYLYEKRVSSRVGLWRFRIVLRQMHRIVVVSTEVEGFLHDLGIPADRVVRIPNAIDVSLFYPASPQECTAARERVGLSTNKAIILYVGRLELIKGLDVLLDAWTLLPAYVHTQALLVLVGDGQARERLQQMVSRSHIESTILFVGEQKDVRDYYWAADVFVLPSRTEGLSNALIEAMACALPVVASCVGGAKDVVEHTENGLLFESGNRTQLAENLSSMIAMRGRWTDMGFKSRQTVTQYANLEAVVSGLERVYAQLLE